MLETIDFTRFLIGDTFRNFVKKGPYRISPSRSFSLVSLVLFLAPTTCPTLTTFVKKRITKVVK